MTDAHRTELARAGLFCATAMNADLSHRQMLVFRVARGTGMCPAAAYNEALRSPR